MDAVLRIKKRKQSEWAIVFILAVTLFYGIIDLIGISAIKYTMDIAWIFLLMTLVANRFRLPNKESRNLFSYVLIFWISTLVGFLVNTCIPQYYLWGFRNNFRFFVFFFACIKCVEARNIDAYLRAMNKLTYIHFVVAMIQYFVFGYKGDHLGGIFGTQDGNNGFSMAFMLIIITFSVLSYLNHRESLLEFAVKGLMMMAVAVCSELKAFFVMCVLIAAMCSLITKFTYKKLFIYMLTVVGVVAGVVLLTRLFPNWAGWFSWNFMMETVLTDQGYTGAGDINRLTAIPTVWNLFLDSWDKRFFGLGLGNCDNATFSFLTTAFYKRHNHLHYHWFSSSFAFVETGIVGLVLYIMFFALTFLGAHKRERAGVTDVLYCQLAKIMSVIAIVLIIYNQSMRTEAAYMVYFVLALPFINNSSVKADRKA